MDSAKRIFLNTAFLYGKMLITILVSLFSTRIILDALGIENFGIFNLVGGVIGMLGFLSGAMAVSTQRYFSYYIGAGQLDKQRDIFKTSVLLHLIIGLGVVIILEVLGIFLFNGLLNIPEERIASARMVYHFMIVSTFFTINAVPYDASINAHENMLVDSIVGVIEAFLKLGIAFWLMNARYDRLITYGILYASMTIIIRLIKSIYCLRNYSECKVGLKGIYEPGIFKEMFTFASWNLFGALCNVIRNQGITIVLNVFIGVIANAAYGIANQINGLLSTFSLNLMRAINPQIVKSEGSGDRKRMLKLAVFACKSSFLLLAIFAVPLIIEMDYVLNLWLKEVPQYAVVFCKLILVISLIKQITAGLMMAIQSIGNIKAYQSVLGTLLILNLPVAIILLKLGLPPYSVLVGSIALEVVAALARTFFANKLAGLSVREFLLKTLIASFASVGFVYLVTFRFSSYFESNFVRVIYTAIVSVLLILIAARFIVFSNEENMKIISLIKTITGDLFKKITGKCK